jgi:predicted ribosome quality control (RQC) complex YloA/Tae2 family protein
MILFCFIIFGHKMKHYELKAIVNYLNNFKIIKHIKRVENNSIKVEFDKNHTLYFDLTKGSSNIYMIQDSVISKNFNAPFDTILQKKLTNSILEKVYLVNDDRVMRFELQVKSSYKQEKLYLQLEFTGIYTNIIILDQNFIVLEALRHISENISSRSVKVGQVLEELPKRDFIPIPKEIENIEEYLYANYDAKEQRELQNLKNIKLKQLKKEEEKLQKILFSLPKEDELRLEAQDTYQMANLLISNIHNIEPYQTLVSVEDFDHTIKEISIPPVQSISNYVNKLFSNAKKLKQKASNLYIEKENLEQKLEFVRRTSQIIQNCSTIESLEFYMPKKEKNQTKTKKEQNYQSFVIDGYKIMLGRNERENIELLENAKANDFWFHLQDIPSSHVIIPTQKKDLPEHIIYQAALLCAKFNSPFGGDYLVDYTKRRELKIQTKANVLYNNYKTIKVKV